MRKTRWNNVTQSTRDYYVHVVGGPKAQKEQLCFPWNEEVRQAKVRVILRISKTPLNCRCEERGIWSIHQNIVCFSLHFSLLDALPRTALFSLVYFPKSLSELAYQQPPKKGGGGGKKNEKDGIHYNLIGNPSCWFFKSLQTAQKTL